MASPRKTTAGLWEQLSLGNWRDRFDLGSTAGIFFGGDLGAIVRRTSAFGIAISGGKDFTAHGKGSVSDDQVASIGLKSTTI